MATTVTYKGTTLTTVDNATKVLETAGTWLEDDLTLTDVSGGGTDYLAESLNNTLTSYTSNDVTGTLPNSAFRGRTNLVSVSFPNVTQGNEYCFDGCTHLASVNIPQITSIKYYMFHGCSSLATFDFSNITDLSNGNMFQQSGLTGMYAPKCTNLAQWNGNCFGGCTSLVYARTPITSTAVKGNVFDGDTSLKLVDLGKASGFGGNVFKNCTALEVLILRNTSLVTLGNVNNFSGVTQNVAVYVPSALKSSYESASNWSTLVSGGIVTFYNLENSAYEQTDFVYMGVPSA